MLGAEDVAVEMVAPAVAIAMLIAIVKSALPVLPGRVLPLLALVLALGYAAGVATYYDNVVADNPVAVLLLAVTVAAQASGLQSWMRSNAATSRLLDRVPGAGVESR